jgi:transglutaminase-like putative cysteine protease
MRAPETDHESRAGQNRSGWRDSFTLSGLGLEAGIVLANLAAFASLARLFTDNGPLPTIAVAILLTHGVALSGRWSKLPWVISALIGALAVGGSILGALLPTTVHHLVIPTASTWHEIDRSMVQAWNVFLTVKAPTEPVLGFVLVGVAGSWLISTISDAIAFRLGFLIEALVPPGVVVILVAALAPDRNRLPALLAFVASVALVVASARVRELSREAWLGRKPKRAGAPGAVLFIATALSIVGYTTLRPPSWVVNGLVDLRSDVNAPRRSVRQASNPLVSTRAHLVNLPDADLFMAKTTNRSYWRLTSLDTYTDDQWTTKRGTYKSEDTSLPANRTPIQITLLKGFDNDWLPSPPLPVAVKGEHENGKSADVKFDRSNNSVLLPTDNRKGDVYTIGTADPDAIAPIGLTDTERQRLLSLPGEVPPSVAELAQTKTASATTDVEKMQALEQFFRREFVYDLEIARSQSLGLEPFLFKVKRGYCEQFASSFAVMARTLGLPSRVAVGFVPGESVPGGLYRVRGKDAHTWPEVFIDGKWLSFEPTPSRGSADQGATTTTTTTISTTTIASATQTSSTIVGSEPVLDPLTNSSGRGIPLATLLRFGALFAALSLLLGIPTAIRRWRARRGFSTDSAGLDPGTAQQWYRLEDDLAWHGSGRESHEPMSVWLDRSATSGSPVDWKRVAALANRVEAHRYAPDVTDLPVSTKLGELGPEIASLRITCNRALPPQVRLKRVMSFSPRPRPAGSDKSRHKSSQRSDDRRRGVGRR